MNVGLALQVALGKPFLYPQRHWEALTLPWTYRALLEHTAAAVR